MEEGPELIQLTDRLVNCPIEYLYEPWDKTDADYATGMVHVYALYGDLIRNISGIFPSESDYKFFLKKSNISNKYLKLVSAIIYLLFDPFFKNKKGLKSKIDSILQKKIFAYVNLVAAKKFVTDPERREELVRFCLYHLDYFPKGENEKGSINKLLSLDSIEREKVIQDTKAAQERAKKLREEIARKEAEESASKMTGE